MTHSEGLVNFWKFACRLKDEQRRGWQQLRLFRAESVADHSFALSALCLYEGVRRGYDVEKLLTMALIHDFHEALTGDLTPRDKKRIGAREVARGRGSAVRQILKSVPDQLRLSYHGMLKELDSGGSREARLVRNLDLLEMTLQASEYRRTGSNQKRLMQFYRSALKGIDDVRLKSLSRELMDSGLY